jgi:glycosyltransferase involved in cell wall biosynthesis
MRIAILTPTFNYYSGMDRVVELQAEELSKKGHKVTVIALEAQIKPKNYKVIELGMPKNPLVERLYRLFFFPDFQKTRFYKKLKEFDQTISHFYPMNWFSYLAKKKYGTKYVYHNHGINTTGLLNSFPQKLYMKVFSFFTNITLSNVDEAYSVSEYLRDDLKKVSNLNSKVIHNRIDGRRFHKNVKGAKITKKYDLKHKKVLLYVGRITPHKGIHLLVGAFELVKRKIPNAKLLIVGKPTFSSYFKKLKRIEDRDVIFTGFVPDEQLPEYYAASDVFVTASQWEGFNLPAVEAQACNKPVVAFNIGSHPEVVKKGSLVKKKDINSFAEAIVRILG